MDPLLKQTDQSHTIPVVIRVLRCCLGVVLLLLLNLSSPETAAAAVHDTSPGAVLFEQTARDATSMATTSFVGEKPEAEDPRAG